MRLLFSANPMYGHVNPLLPLADAAVRAGHEVRFATGPDLVDHVRRHGIDAVGVGPRYAAVRNDASESWISFFLRLARRRAHELLALARAWRPDVVVHDETDLAGAVAAAAVGARHVVHALGMPPPAALWTAAVAELDRIGGEARSGDLGRRLADATYVQAWPASLEPSGATFWSCVVRMRPTIAVGAGGDEQSFVGADLPHPRSVHVTLGTVFNHRVTVLRQLVDAVGRLPVNVLVATGPGIDPASLGVARRDVRVRSYVSYDRVLPLCSAVVSHAGAGVVLGSLVHGLPQLLVPQGADQYGNADACVAAGAGLSLVDRPLDPRSVTESLCTLLDDPSYAAAASAIRDEIETMPSPASVVEQLT